MNTGGVKVSTEKWKINCMRRISVGLLKKPVKQLNANKNEGKFANLSDYFSDKEEMVLEEVRLVA